jgi:peroxiredoxin
MKRILLVFLASVTLLSCNRECANIKGIVEGLNKDTLVLKVLAVNSQQVVDTIITEEGKISYRLKLSGTNPDFYYLYYRERLIASFIPLPGDYIKFATDTTASKYIIEGSKESGLLEILDRNARLLKSGYDSLMTLYTEAMASANKTRATELNYQLGSLYVKHKQGSIKKIFTEPLSITNVALLYERFPNGLPIFSEPQDVLIFTRVRDSLKKVYPGSPYIAKLSEEIARIDNINALNLKLSEAAQSGYPEITLPDINAKKISLKDYSGNVILLSFWNSSDVNQRLLNQEYLSLYDRFSAKGFTIFQVAADIDKTSWANTVREQKLPWISVCDGLGASSPALKSFNVTSLPVNFLIDKEGTITGKNLKGEELIREITRALK